MGTPNLLKLRKLLYAALHGCQPHFRKNRPESDDLHGNIWKKVCPVSSLLTICYYEVTEGNFGLKYSVLAAQAHRETGHGS